MNQAEVIHAGWAHKDPSNMSLLEVCQADVRDAIILDVELKAYCAETATGGNGPSYNKRKRKQYEREINQAKQIGSEMFQHQDKPDGGRKIDPASSFRPKEKKKQSRNSSKSQNVRNETAVASTSRNSTLTVQQNPSLSSGLHETSRLSFQPSAAYAEHGTSNSTLTSNFQSPQFQMAHFQASRVERRGSEDGPHLEATFLHAQKHLFETSPNQSSRQTSLTYTPDPSQLPQLQIPQTCQRINAGYSNTHHFLQFQPPHMAFSPETRGSTFSTTCNTSSNQQTTQSNEQWHSGMSPFPYEIVLLPNNVRKCYGCGNDFAKKYRKPPFNLIVKQC